MRVFSNLEYKAVRWKGVPHIEILEDGKHLLYLTVGLMAEDKPIILCKAVDEDKILHSCYPNGEPSDYYMIKDGTLHSLVFTQFHNKNIDSLGYFAVLQNRENIKYMLNISKEDENNIIIKLPRVSIRFIMNTSDSLLIRYPIKVEKL